MNRDDFSLEILRTWGIGQRDKNNGVLLLVAISDRDVRIEVGYGLEGALPDGKCGRILDTHFVPSMRNGDTDAAILKTYDAILIEIANENDIDPQRIIEGTGYSISNVDSTDGEEGVGYIIIGVIVLLGLLAMPIIAVINFLRSLTSRPIGSEGGNIGSSRSDSVGGNSGRIGDSSGSGGSRSGGSSRGGGGSGGGGGAGRKW
jgi:uncharacterized protein